MYLYVVSLTVKSTQKWIGFWLLLFWSIWFYAEHSKVKSLGTEKDSQKEEESLWSTARIKRFTKMMVVSRINLGWVGHSLSLSVHCWACSIKYLPTNNNNRLFQAKTHKLHPQEATYLQKTGRRYFVTDLCFCFFFVSPTLQSRLNIYEIIWSQFSFKGKL